MKIKHKRIIHKPKDGLSQKRKYHVQRAINARELSVDIGISR